MSIRYKILVLKNRMIGDAVLSLSSLQYIKHILPNCELHFASSKMNVSLFEMAKISCDKIIALDFKNISQCLKSARTISEEKYDYILELNQSGRTAKFFNLLKCFVFFKYYAHNHNLDHGTFVLNQGIRLPNIQRDLDLIYSFLTKVLKLKIANPNHLEFTPEISFHNQVLAKENTIVFGMVATRETKKLPLITYLQLAALIEGKLPNYKILVPLSNSAEDQVLAQKILDEKKSNNIEILKVPLNQIPHRLAQAKIYVGNDTGLKHVAVAVKIPTITFFGPEEPYEWHPYDLSKNPVFFIDKLDCRTRVSHFCGLSTCDSMICLNQFKAEDIFSKILELLK